MLNCFMLNLQGKTIHDFFGKELTRNELEQLIQSSLWHDDLGYEFLGLFNPSTESLKAFKYRICAPSAQAIFN